MLRCVVRAHYRVDVTIEAMEGICLGGLDCRRISVKERDCCMKNHLLRVTVFLIRDRDL